MATHSSFLACKIPWTEEPGRLQSIGSQRVRHNGSDLAHAHTSTCIPQAGVGLLTLISNLKLGLQVGFAYTSSFYTHCNFVKQLLISLTTLRLGKLRHSEAR